MLPKIPVFRVPLPREVLLAVLRPNVPLLCPKLPNGELGEKASAWKFDSARLATPAKGLPNVGGENVELLYGLWLPNPKSPPPVLDCGWQPDRTSSTTAQQASGMPGLRSFVLFVIPSSMRYRHRVGRTVASGAESPFLRRRRVASVRCSVNSTALAKNRTFGEKYC